MKLSRPTISIIIILIMVLGVGIWLVVSESFQRIRYAPQFPNPDVSNPQFFAIFEGRIPCTTSEILKGCQVTKMRLTLFKDPQTNNPTTYKLERVYVGLGNDKYTTEGNWTIIPDKKTILGADIYQLDENTPTEYRWFLTVGKNILLEVDQDQNIKVGNAGAIA